MNSDRRRFLARGLAASFAATTTWRTATGAASRPAGLVFGEPRPFSFDLLRARARDLASKAFVPPTTPAADIIRGVSFDAIQAITYRPEYTLWRAGPEGCPVRFFHLNRYATVPVHIYAVSGATSREILYQSNYFEYGDSALAAKLPANLGFSGFRVMNGHNSDTDWLAFQGASYFRAAGSQDQYGASARGIAVNTALSSREEFPRFTDFWLKGSQDQSRSITIYALLDGESITGAYQIEARSDNGVIMDVRAELHARSNIQRLGIAPLTSMYWYRANELHRPLDWRPAIHDSDGLAMWTGQGERIWRPLNDPPTVQTNSFADKHAKGFGLSQRDRDFADYQDDGAFYERRPSIWIEPLEDWGEGVVQLVEIPTDDEIHDNIVAYWQPHAAVTAGNTLEYRYRLRWQADDPPPGAVARVIATRIGVGGVPGRPRPKNQWKFVIDFEGGELKQMKARYDVQPVVTVSRGSVTNPYSVKVVGTSRWRAFFDVAMEGKEPLNMRCFLRLDGRTMSETWLYQFFPAD